VTSVNPDLASEGPSSEFVSPEAGSIGFGAVGRSLRAAASSDVIERLIDVGFLASECGLHDAAKAIFADLMKLRPNNPSMLISAAFVQARRGEIEGTIEQLRGVVARFEESEMAKAMLGTYLVQNGEKGALALFEDVLGTARDRSAVNVVRCSLELAQRAEAPSNVDDMGDQK
jgi:Bacterial type III secretion protein (HrpB1_HrpK)